MSIFRLGIDLGKNVCSLVGLDETGAVVRRRRLRRDGVVDFVGKLPVCIVAMEACCGAHHLGRVLGAAGHTIRLMSPEYVRPYVKANTNDDLDAEAIAEAATRPTMRFVPIRSEPQSGSQCQAADWQPVNSGNENSLMISSGHQASRSCSSVLSAWTRSNL